MHAAEVCIGNNFANKFTASRAMTDLKERPKLHDDKTERFMINEKALQQGFFLNRAVRCVDIISAPKN